MRRLEQSCPYTGIAKKLRLLTSSSRRAGLLLVFFLVCAGCSQRAADRPATPAAGASQPEIPFLIRVVEEKNDGRNIFVAGEIESRAAWDSRDLLLRLSSYSTGELLRENFFHMPQSNALSASGSGIAAGETARFALSVPAQGVSDYQLELLWGKDAKQYKTRAEDAGALKLELKDVELQSADCREEECEVPFFVLGRFHNAGAVPINKIRLAASLVREEEAPPVSASGEASLQEEAVEVTELALTPGESRAFKISIAEQAGRRVQPGVRPYVRILGIE